MNGNERRARADKPLLGAVLCCTSVSPEQRTQYAEYATQMGAEHKLDLTSDVTHLLVGDTNTLKYQYVARERDDVKVLQPEWVEAVRECWMNDERVNLNELDERYRLPTFAGLKICITGFDDLAFRAQLQEYVAKNGGEYTGDLTKDVTHLIANTCEGKKFQYATQWEKKIVGLKWLQDSLDRKMQLDETLYHPSKPVNEQGIGAWNREAQLATQFGKRTRPEEMAPEPPRKLRRTASARLGSQNENLWGDIVGGGGFETTDRERETIRPSKSMPAVYNEKQVDRSFVGEDSVSNRPRHVPDSSKPTQSFFTDKCFCILEFDCRKANMLTQIIKGNGGTVALSLTELAGKELPYDDQLVLVPHSVSRSRLTEAYDLDSLPKLVTELWVECCMERKIFVIPDQYPPGGVFEQIPVDGFGSLSVSSTGLQGIELLHVSKMIKLMGAQYDEIFRSSTSVLVCNGSDLKSSKALHASEWGTPMVSVAWLWSCIKACQFRPFNEYLLASSIGARVQVGGAARQPREAMEVQAAKRDEDRKQQVALQQFEQKQLKVTGMSAKELPNEKRYGELSQMQQSGSDFFEEANTEPAKGRRTNANTLTRRKKGQADAAKIHEEMPLKEISTNSPPKSQPLSPEKQKKKPLFRTIDGSGSMPETELEEQCLIQAPMDLEPLEVNAVVQNARSINVAIQDLLNMRARAKSNTSSNTDVSSKRKKLLGRALSNLSNSSMGSNVRASRASSVDTMNTDGVGSEIAAETSQANGRSGASSGGTRGSFTGRAKARATSAGTNDASIELGDGVLCAEDLFGAEEIEFAPQQTQLGYEDSDEAILLREKLAERRRERSREGQVDGDIHKRQQKDRSILDRPQKRIKDDDVLIDGNTGWGAGRRTRQKDRSPQGLKEF